MKRIAAVLFGLILLAAPALAQAPATVKLCTQGVGTSCPPVTATAPLPVTGGGASSSFGAAFPATGTAVGFTDGTNMVAGRVRNPGSGAGSGDAAVVVVDPNLAALALTLGPAAIVSSVPVIPSSQYPGNDTAAAAPITGNSTGSTGAVVGTLAAAASKTTFICGFNISALGGVASIGPVTVAGLIGSSQVYQLPVNATAGQILVTQNFNPCIPASAVNTAITITTTADGTATAVDVNSWGYQL